MQPEHDVHRFRIPVMAGYVDLRLRRVGERQFQVIGTLVVSKSLRFKFRSAGDFEVDVVDPTGLAGQALTIWPQVVQFLRTASAKLNGGTETEPEHGDRTKGQRTR